MATTVAAVDPHRRAPVRACRQPLCGGHERDGRRTSIPLDRGRASARASRSTRRAVRCSGAPGDGHLPHLALPAAAVPATTIAVTDDNGTEATMPLSLAISGTDVSLEVARAGDGSGEVSSNPGGIDRCGSSDGRCRADFEDMTKVTLTATPAASSSLPAGRRRLQRHRPLCDDVDRRPPGHRDLRQGASCRDRSHSPGHGERGRSGERHEWSRLLS